MVWDEPKRKTNLEAHRLDFADARDRFEWETAVIGETYPDPATGKPRLFAIGYLDGTLLYLVFAPLAISLRPASTRERKRYEQG